MSWQGKFAELTAKTHTEQAHWWLNGFWEDGAKDYAEDVWQLTHKFIETQIDGPVLYGSKSFKVDEESDLDELKSHRLLELVGETLTVIELRKRLKELDIDTNNRMALSEYLIDKYKKTPDALVNSPQGEIDPEELAAAQAACDKASALLDQASTDAQEAARSLKASQDAAAAAAESLKEAQEAAAKAEQAKKDADAAQAAAQAAEAELQAAVDEIEALEKAKADKVAKCQAIIDDPNASTVKKGGAVQEKEQTLSEDPLPLRKAKITQTAALKKLTKARQLADSAAEDAAAAKKRADQAAADSEAAKQKADQAAADAADAKARADQAQAEAEAGFAEAQAALEELKTKGTGTPQGKIWWMERVLIEKKKFTK